MITLETCKRGALNGLKTSLMLLKIIIPVFAVVTILGHTAVMAWLSKLFAPIMNFVGLPGEAAVAFVTGAFINIYVAIGITIALHLSPWELTTLALMLNLSHELFLESAVLKKTGITVWPIAVMRLMNAFLVGGVMNMVGHQF
jgi:Fe2+ transport system protein B